MYRILVGTLSFCIIQNVQAQSAIKDVNRQLDFVLGGQSVYYVERDKAGKTSDGVLDSERGSQPFAKLTYTLQGDAADVSDVYFNASMAYSRGKTRYNGYLQSAGVIVSPYQTVTHVSTFDFEVRLGKGFSFLPNRNAQLTPYVAYSYHMWERDLSFDPYGYLEVYEHQAVALGTLAQVAVTPHLVASLDLSIGKMINPNMTINHSTKFNLGSKPVESVGIGFDYALKDGWHIKWGYRMTRFGYGESPPALVSSTLLYEPQSKTTLHNIYLGIGSSF